VPSRAGPARAEEVAHYERGWNTVLDGLERQLGEASAKEERE